MTAHCERTWTAEDPQPIPSLHGSFMRQWAPYLEALRGTIDGPRGQRR